MGRYSELPSIADVQRPFAHLDVDFVHPTHVARLSLALFDQTGDLHGLGERERWRLWCAGLLHDVGYAHGWQAHHKHSLAVILATETPLFDDHEKRLVACLARYHRRAWPKVSHDVYGTLPEAERNVVIRLAALLRVGDGLDRGQVGAVRDIAVTAPAPRTRLVRRYADRHPATELYAAKKKADLFEDTFGVELGFEYAGRSQSTE